MLTISPFLRVELQPPGAAATKEASWSAGEGEDQAGWATKA